MLTNDLIAETYTAITVNKVRTFLTILGIVIGIGSVITMTAIGRGAQSDIEENIKAIGSNLLTVSGGTGRGGFGPVNNNSSRDTLTTADVALIAEKSQYISDIAPQASTRTQVIAGSENVNTTVQGVTDAYIDVRSRTMAYGTFISSVDDHRLGRVAALGFETATSLFGEGDEERAVGQVIRIDGSQFDVIGVVAANGTSDDVVYAPLSTVQQYLLGEKKIDSISISVTDAANMTIAEEELVEILLASHGIKDATAQDFTIRNQADIVETASSVTGAFTGLLAAIASISLLVGGIGIMNMMLTSVTERTREIGLRKALGATTGDIRKQFLLEAITLTLFGGVLGVVLGVGISSVVSAQFGLTTAVSQTSIFIAFGVSALIGIVFGIYPAWRASNFDPMEALRYE